MMLLKKTFLYNNCETDKGAELFLRCHHKSVSGFAVREAVMALVIVCVVVLVLFLVTMNLSDEKQWHDAQLKAKNSIAEAFKDMSLKSIATDTLTTEQFALQVLPEYLKIEKVCNTPKDCGFPTKLKRPDGQKIELRTSMETITAPNTTVVSGSASSGKYSSVNDTTEKYNNAVFFITDDGFHVMFFYNPYCVNNQKDKPYFTEEKSSDYKNNSPQMSLDTVCYYGVYDANGEKLPNQVGKDIGFVGSFYNGEQARAVSVIPYHKDISTLELPVLNANSWLAAYNYCKTLDKNKWELPDINELSLLYLNRYFVTDNTEKRFWSRSNVPSSFPPPPAYQTVNFSDGVRYWTYFSSTSDIKVICTKKTDTLNEK